MISLTRRYQFSASHRLHVKELSALENSRLFGKCNNPFGHGHNYTLEVTVAGKPDTESGLLLPLPKLDQMVQRHVLRIFAHRNLNVDVAPLAKLVPTTENVALVIANLLQDTWQSWFEDYPNVRLIRVQVQETERNGFEVDLAAQKSGPILLPRHESVPVNV